MKFIDTKYPYTEITSEQAEGQNENNEVESSRFDSRRTLAKIDNTQKLENNTEEQKEPQTNRQQLSTFGRKVRAERAMKKLSHPNLNFYQYQLSNIEKDRNLSSQAVNRSDIHIPKK